LVAPELRPTYRRSAIDRHLKNEFYAAIPNPHDGFQSQFVWRGTFYEGKHEPVFAADEWERLKASFSPRAGFRRVRHEGLFAQGALSLTCGDLECGCKITYAPKSKPRGITYRSGSAKDWQHRNVGGANV
jgi:hypothetical protein